MPDSRQPPRNRRELRRTIRGQTGGPAGSRPRPGGPFPGGGPRRPGPAGRSPGAVSVPPVAGFALVMLAMCALIGLVGGVLLVVRRPAIGVPLLVLAGAAGWTAWALARGTRAGYWAGVGLLAVVGLVPGGLAIAAGAPAAAVVLLAPLLVAVLMLRPSARAAIVRRPAGPPTGPGGASKPGRNGESRDARRSGR